MEGCAYRQKACVPQQGVHATTRPRTAHLQQPPNHSACICLPSVPFDRL